MLYNILLFVVIYLLVFFYFVANSVNYARKQGKDTTFTKKTLYWISRKVQLKEFFFMSVVIFILLKAVSFN